MRPPALVAICCHLEARPAPLTIMITYPTRSMAGPARAAAGSRLHGERTGGRFVHRDNQTSDVILNSPPVAAPPARSINRRALPPRPAQTVTVPGFRMQVDSRLVGNPIALSMVHTGLPGTLVATPGEITYVTPGGRPLKMQRDGMIVSPGATEDEDICFRTHWDSPPAELVEDVKSTLCLAIADDAAQKAQLERSGEHYEMTQVVVEEHAHRTTVQLFFEDLQRTSRGSLYYDTASEQTSAMDGRNRPLQTLNPTMKIGEVIRDLAPSSRNPGAVFKEVVRNFQLDPDHHAALPTR